MGRDARPLRRAVYTPHDDSSPGPPTCEPMMGEDEFTALFTDLYGRLLRFAARRLSPQSAADAVSQTFLTAWDKRDQCPSDPDERNAWVFGIGRYKVLQESDHRRRKHHDHRFADDVPHRPPSEPDFADTVVESDAGRWVYDQLSSGERRLFDLAFVHGLTREQAALLLSVSISTFNTRVCRLRARIRALVRSADVVGPGS